MTRSSPRSVFTSVDLPTLGRPTTAIFTGAPAAAGSSSCAAAGTAASASSARRSTLSPCAAEIGYGSPRPSSWNSATARSGAMPSALLTATNTGRPDLRRRCAMSRSCGAMPDRPSTSSTTASASAIAARVCFAISCRMPLFATGSKPPVSTTMNRRPPALPRPYWRSRVRPGKSATSAARLFVRRLNSVDLPTFGRPTRTRIGSIGGATRRELPPAGLSAARHRVERAGLGLPHGVRAGLRGLRGRRRAVGGRTADELAVVAVEQVDVAFRVLDEQEVAGDLHAADVPRGELVLFPCRGAGHLVERMHRTGVVGDEQEAVVEREPGEARDVAGPDELAADDVEAGDAALVGDRAHLPILDHGERRHVGDALELRRAFRRRHVALPADVARHEIEREQLAAGGTGEEGAPARRAPGVVADREGRIGPLVDPLRLAVGGGQSVDPPVAGPDDDDPVGYARRSQHFARNARRPPLLAVGAVREHVALVGADDDERRIGADARGELAAGLDPPYDRPARRIDARDGAARRRRVDRVRRDGRGQPRRRLAERHLPDDLHARGGREVGHRRDLLAAAEHRGEPAEARRGDFGNPRRERRAAAADERERRDGRGPDEPRARCAHFDGAGDVGAVVGAGAGGLTGAGGFGTTLPAAGGS